MEFTNDNITDFISGMISLGGGDYVEAGPEKFVMMKSGKNQVSLILQERIGSIEVETCG